MATLVRSKSKIKDLLRKWQSFKNPGTAYGPVDSKLRKTKSSTWSLDSAKQVHDVDDVSSASQSENSSATTADDVPTGHLAVYVGRERRRFVIDAHYLNNTLVRGLIEKSGDENATDRDRPDGLTIACEVVLFEHLLWLIETNDPDARQMETDELLDYYKY
jgi:hypothetical protein